MPMAASLSSDSLDSAARPAAAFTTTRLPGMPGPPMPQTTTINRVGSSPEPKPIEIRKEFPETWLFDSLDFDSR